MAGINLMVEKTEGEIYKAYHDKVFGYIFNRTGSYHDAEDLCSTVFMKIYSHLESFDDSKASLSTWIFNITRNTLYDHYRTSHPAEEFQVNMVDERMSYDTQDDICNAETLKELANALEKLPDRERDLILLHYYRKVTLKEIAEMLGISYSYAKILHNKALDKLKESMEKCM